MNLLLLKIYHLNLIVKKVYEYYFSLCIIPINNIKNIAKILIVKFIWYL